MTLTGNIGKEVKYIGTNKLLSNPEPTGQMEIEDEVFEVMDGKLFHYVEVCYSTWNSRSWHWVPADEVTEIPFHYATVAG